MESTEHFLNRGGAITQIQYGASSGKVAYYDDDDSSMFYAPLYMHRLYVPKNAPPLKSFKLRILKEAEDEWNEAIPFDEFAAAQEYIATKVLNTSPQSRQQGDRQRVFQNPQIGDDIKSCRLPVIQKPPPTDHFLCKTKLERELSVAAIREKRARISALEASPSLVFENSKKAKRAKKAQEYLQGQQARDEELERQHHEWDEERRAEAIVDERRRAEAALEAALEERQRRAMPVAPPEFELRFAMFVQSMEIENRRSMTRGEILNLRRAALQMGVASE